MSINEESKRDRDAAERLKAQGNELHQKGRYQDAYMVYSDAIKQDPGNAVLYANRAAASLSLKEYLDAAQLRDFKASYLDPTYAKAWGRLGKASHALSSWTKCIPAWEKALACLPPNDEMSSPAEKRMGAEFKEGLKKSQDAMKQPKAPLPPVFSGFEDPENVPWKRALSRERQLNLEDKWSSGFVIISAYREFSKGVESMKLFSETHLGNGQSSLVGKTDAIVNLSNGILREPRVFHIDSQDWFIKYNTQASFEARFYKAWVNDGPKTIQKEAPQRLEREGWPPVRKALACTVRAWIVRAFVESSTGNRAVGSEFYRHILEILEWGRRIWSDISKEDRGVVFELSFVRGVKRLYLTALHERLAVDKDAVCDFTKEDLAELARQLVFETDAHPPIRSEADGYGFLLSFWMYPKGEALSILGWYHMQRAQQAEQADDKLYHFAESVSYYIQAAEMFPEDDEYHPYFLKFALEAYWGGGVASRRECLALCKRIRLSIPKMAVFWQTSQIAKI
ncbi:hypothetical protein K443DRAFT_6459 [Laccaria amethystina LaAM-08-1]|uniref:Uncharacterized protein n=1 Tax=Laccaria amethystina LaAM-08-1 TaxID=1095629 RepID=A0A0C9XWQ6_9AGAR|nr:hypothetical protein K443DRAFT_6459 [Laccaria amethystina LaAM-08-1]